MRETLLTFTGVVAALICGSTQAASLTFEDFDDGTIDIFTGQFEGGFTVNGVQIAPPGPAGAVSGSALGVSESNGPITFSGTWIDLGQAARTTRTIYFVDPVDTSFVRDIFQFTVRGAGPSRATIAGTWRSSLSGPLGDVPPGTAASNIRVADGANVGFSHSFLGARARSLPDSDGPTEVPEVFSIIVLPDTQMYSEAHPEILEAQMDWIVANEDSENIIYVAHLGDLKDDSSCDNKVINAGTGAGRTEWQILNGAFTKLDNANIAYGVVPGNHDFDQVSNDCPNFTTERPLTTYNMLFGPTRFAGDPWYGDPAIPTAGNRVVNSNEDNFTLFEGVCGVKFIAINLAYKQGANAQGQDQELQWADALLKTYSDRLGILTTHYFLEENPGNAFGPYGQETYDELSDNPNFFMMLSAHERGEAWRVDATNRGGMQPVHALLADYQSTEFPASDGDPNTPPTDPNPANLDFSDLDTTQFGDSGFMRIMRFDPETHTVDVETFIPPVVPIKGRPSRIVSTYFPADGTGMDRFTASNFSLSFQGYGSDSNCSN